jgi:hypothetical protein
LHATKQRLLRGVHVTICSWSGLVDWKGFLVAPQQHTPQHPAYHGERQKATALSWALTFKDDQVASWVINYTENQATLLSHRFPEQRPPNGPNRKHRTVRTHQTHIEAEKQSYIRSKDGRGPSATGPWNGPQRKIQPIVVCRCPATFTNFRYNEQLTSV